MKILLLHQFFILDSEPGGSRHIFLCRFFKQQGAEVQVIAGAVNYMTGKSKLPFYRLWKKEEIDGIAITWVSCLPFLKFGMIGKILCYLSFFFLSLPFVFAAPADVLIATSPPPSAALMGWLSNRLKKIPWVLEIRDLWPEMIRDLGVKIGFLARTADKIIAKFYRDSSFIVPLTNGFAKIIAQKGIPMEKMRVIPNGVDPIFEDRVENEREPAFNKSGKFSVFYVGSMGRANQLETLLKIAEKLVNYRDIQFIFVGDGVEKKKLMREASVKKLDNVLFLEPVPRKEVPDFLEKADLCFLTHAQTGSFSAFIPNRLFDYLAVGKPVLLLLEKGDASQILEESGGGVQVSPKDTVQAVKAILELKSNPEKRKKMGELGKQYVFKKFLRKDLAAEYFKVLKEIAEKKSCGRGFNNDLAR